MLKRIDVLKFDKLFLKACELTKIKPTKRQVSKFDNGYGLAFAKRNEAIDLLNKTDR